MSNNFNHIAEEVLSLTIIFLMILFIILDLLEEITSIVMINH